MFLYSSLLEQRWFDLGHVLSSVALWQCLCVSLWVGQFNAWQILDDIFPWNLVLAFIFTSAQNVIYPVLPNTILLSILCFLSADVLVPATTASISNVFSLWVSVSVCYRGKCVPADICCSENYPGSSCERFTRCFINPQCLSVVRDRNWICISVTFFWSTNHPRCFTAFVVFTCTRS